MDGKNNGASQARLAAADIRERLLRVRNEADETRKPIELWEVFMRDILGRKKPKDEVEYTFGRNSSTSVGRRRTDKVIVKPGQYLAPPDESGTASKHNGASQTVCGEYTLEIDLGDGHPAIGITLKYGKVGKPQLAPLLGQMVPTVQAESYVFKRRYSKVNTKHAKGYADFCWLDMHPQNSDSAFRNQASMPTLGGCETSVSISAPAFDLRHPYKFSPNVAQAKRDSEIESKHSNAEATVAIMGLDNDALRALAKLAGISEIDLGDPMKSRRVQLIAIVESTSRDTNAVRQLVLEQLKPKSDSVAKTVADGVAMGIIEIVDGDFIVNGKNLADHLSAVGEWVGREQDYLVYKLSKPENAKIFNMLEHDVQVAMNEAEDIMEAGKGVRDEMAAKRVAAVAAAESAGMLKKVYDKLNKWVVVTDTGHEEFCGLKIGKGITKEDQLAHLLKIASEKTDDYVYGKLALAKAVATAPES